MNELRPYFLTFLICAMIASFTGHRGWATIWVLLMLAAFIHGWLLDRRNRL